MANAEATVTTPNGSRYLQQLCKHWAHKFAVDFDAERGRIDLGEGQVCTMRAYEDRLMLRAEAGDADALPRLEQVIADHIRRFAFREDLMIDWTTSAAA